VRQTSQKRYKYVGKERDEETGLYYYGFRYYAAWICRFVSVDPLQFDYPYYTPFQYAGNKPITYIDLDGLEEFPNPFANVSTKENPVYFKEDEPVFNDTENGKSNPLRNMQIRQNRSSNIGPLKTSARSAGFHAGHDLYAIPDTEVFATGDASVFALNDDPRKGKGYGKAVVLKHTIKVFDGYTKDKVSGEYVIPKYKNFTYYTFSAHLNSFAKGLNIGDKVKAGQLIGLTGNSGNADTMEGLEQHLHFEVGTEIWWGGPGNSLAYLKRESLLDPNFTYRDVNFKSENSNTFSGTTGIIKSIFNKNGSLSRIIMQNYKGLQELGSDKLIFPMNDFNDTNDKETKNQY